MLCAGNSFVNIEEPLSPANRQTLFRSPQETWYRYICPENESLYLDYYLAAIAFRPHPIEDIRRMHLGSRDPLRVFKHWSEFGMGKVQRRRALFRDPFAVFSIRWFRDRLGCDTVVIVMHPAAVVSSLKRLQASFDFRELLDQRLLMESLEEFRGEMEASLEAPDDVIAQGCLLWRIIYATVHPDVAAGHVRLVRHEDLSLDPVARFKELYEALGVPFTHRAESRIITSTSDRNPREVSLKNPFDTRLASRANLANWRHRLLPEEIDRIRTLTADVAPLHYAEDDWPE
jgi:hypothetical protein